MRFLMIKVSILNIFYIQVLMGYVEKKQAKKQAEKRLTGRVLRGAICTKDYTR